MNVSINGYEGQLPGPAKVKTYVGDKYANGETIYLYYYNEDSGKIELVGGRGLKVDGGYVEYVLTHCSVYILTSKTPEEIGAEEEVESVKGEWKSDSTGWWFEYEDTEKGYPAGKWYHFDESGYMQTGWTKADGKWYYMDSSGAMKTGWLLDGETWYYLSNSGAMATGWVKVVDEWYYFYASGVMANDTYIGEYYVNADGAWKE